MRLKSCPHCIVAKIPRTFAFHKSRSLPWSKIFLLTLISRITLDVFILRVLYVTLIGLNSVVLIYVFNSHYSRW